jgi:multidrug efflux pump subunit AcrA (membrane-fusion protein)
MAAMRSRVPYLNLGLVVLIAAGGAWAGTAVGSPASGSSVLRTATVSRGVVQSMVSASGTLMSSTTYNLGFETGGQVTEIDVSPGEVVSAGQVLARVDPSSAERTLETAQADLNAAEANLAQIQQVQTPQEQAQSAAQVNSAQQAVNADQTSLNDARTVAASNAVNYQTAVEQAQQQLAADQAAGAPASTIMKDQFAVTNAENSQTNGLARDQQSVDQAQNALNQAQASLNLALSQAAVSSQPPRQGTLASAQASVVSAQASVASAQQAVDGTTLVAPAGGTITAINGQVGEFVGGSGSGSSAGQGASSVSSAASGSGSSSSGGSGTGGSPSGAGSTSAGSGSASSGSGSSGSGSSGSGSSGSGSGSSGSGSSGSGSSGSGSSSSSSGFITLVDATDLSVQAGFSEVDAANVAVGQPASVTFDAVPGYEAAGRVVSVDTTATTVSNVVTYYATISLNSPDSRLKPGMTATANVMVGEADNVLAVPSSAVRTFGTTKTVTVLRNGQQVTTPVTTGVVGDTETEITSGLQQGDQVVLASGGGIGRTGGGLPRGLGGLIGGGLGGRGGGG